MPSLFHTIQSTSTPIANSQKDTITYQYNSFGEPIKIADNDETKEITYNTFGEVIKEVTGLQTNSYQYDKAGRLTNETINSVPTAYTYDAWSNRASMTGNGTSSTYTYDANNRLTKSITEEGTTTTTADYYYDHNGNQITKAVNVTTPQSGIAAYFMSPETNSYLSLYEYDSYNRLKSADTDGTVTTYAYDGNNLRQSKTTNGITTQHVWDGSNMVMDGTNKFYRGATGIEFATLNGNTSFYHKDAHGDVTALTDSAGIITQSYIYDAFGNQINENENDINPFRYCGEYQDAETGLTYLRNRYYDNSIGRFISKDTHWNINNMIYGDKEYKKEEKKAPNLEAILQANNLYVYALNNPTRFSDSNGESVSIATVLTISVAIITPAMADGFITGGIYLASGKTFMAGFVNGFVSGLGTGIGVVIGGPTGAVFGNIIGSGLGSVVEDLMYNKNATPEEIAKSAAESAVWAIIGNVSSSYWDEAIEIANQAGSAAKELMQYDENFGKAIKKFFEVIVDILSAQ